MSSRMPARLLAGLFLLGSSLAISCGDATEVQAEEPGGVQVELELPRDAAGAVQEGFQLEEWVEGPARLELVGMTRQGAAVRSDVRGAEVHVEEESGERFELLAVAHSREAQLWSAELPGEGARPLRLSFQASPEYVWLGARIIRRAEPQSPSRLAGSLRGRSVVLFLTDALAAEHMSCYGNPRPTTPNLDRMAAEGVRFAQAYSQTSWTLPSVASLFTSLEQERHDVRRMTDQLAPETSTLAQSFQAAGYRTVALVQNGVVWSHTGLDRGFEDYRLFEWRPEAFAELLAATRAVLAEPADRPLFLYVHMIPPHGPLMPPPDLRERFAAGYTGPIDGSMTQAKQLVQRKPAPDHPDVLQLAALYDAYLCYADREIGVLLDGLKDAGREQDFLFAHLSDHGEAFFEHGVLGHEIHVHEEMVRIPLILKAAGSGLSAGSVVESPVSILDVLPTLVELCDLPAPRTPPMGRSLLRALDDTAGPARSARALVLSSRYRGGHPSRQIAMVADGYKWLVHRTPGARRGELFDLMLDPGEQRNVVAEHPLRAQAMDRFLVRWEKEAREGAVKSQFGSDSRLDPEVQKQMHQLGYTED